jgi:hypothetical protein
MIIAKRVVASDIFKGTGIYYIIKVTSIWILTRLRYVNPFHDRGRYLEVLITSSIPI